MPAAFEPRSKKKSTTPAVARVPLSQRARTLEEASRMGTQVVSSGGGIPGGHRREQAAATEPGSARSASRCFEHVVAGRSGWRAGGAEHLLEKLLDALLEFNIRV